jgi:hypothetical protein
MRYLESKEKSALFERDGLNAFKSPIFPDSVSFSEKSIVLKTKKTIVPFGSQSDPLVPLK